VKTILVSLVSDQTTPNILAIHHVNPWGKRQLLRSGTSVGAHYREAQRSRSNAEFISKIEGGLQELEEAMYWMELLIGAGIVKEQLLEALRNEANEIMAILVTCTKKVKSSTRGY
jgi:four helix bundle protein